MTETIRFSEAAFWEWYKRAFPNSLVVKLNPEKRPQSSLRRRLKPVGTRAVITFDYAAQTVTIQRRRRKSRTYRYGFWDIATRLVRLSDACFALNAHSFAWTRTMRRRSLYARRAK